MPGQKELYELAAKEGSESVKKAVERLTRAAEPDVAATGATASGLVPSSQTETVAALYTRAQGLLGDSIQADWHTVSKRLAPQIAALDTFVETTARAIEARLKAKPIPGALEARDAAKIQQAEASDRYRQLLFEGQVRHEIPDKTKTVTQLLQEEQAAQFRLEVATTTKDMPPEELTRAKQYHDAAVAQRIQAEQDLAIAEAALQVELLGARQQFDTAVQSAKAYDDPRALYNIDELDTRELDELTSYKQLVADLRGVKNLRELDSLAARDQRVADIIDKANLDPKRTADLLLDILERVDRDNLDPMELQELEATTEIVARHAKALGEVSEGGAVW
jgi:hypothetical protein